MHRAANPDIRHRLIYVGPARTDHVIPFNVLAAQAEHPYDVAAAVLEGFRRTWPECLREAPHFPNAVTAALIVLIENGLTLMNMPRLLTNTEFREQCLERVTDTSIVEFFHDRYDRWGREAPLMWESMLNKIGAFSLNPRLKLMLGQRANHLDFRQVTDEGKILLLDLGCSDGETNRLIGSLVVTGLELAMVALSNVQTKVIFGIGRRDAEYFAKPIGRSSAAWTPGWAPPWRVCPTYVIGWPVQKRGRNPGWEVAICISGSESGNPANPCSPDRRMECPLLAATTSR